MEFNPDDITEDKIKKWYKDKEKAKEEPVDKFATIKDYEIDCNFDFSAYALNKKYNICLVYCVWSTNSYFKLLYLSLVSQFKFTDVTDVDIKIFVDTNLYDEAVYYFESCPVELIEVDPPFNKFNIVTHPSLADYSRIIISDCDTFMFGQKTDLYKRINESNINTLYMMEDRDKNTIRVFEARYDLCRGIESMDEYKQFFASFFETDIDSMESIIKANQWHLSCFMQWNQRFSKHPEWLDHCKKCSEIKTWCDETVFLTFAWKYGYTVEDFSSINGVNVILAHQVSDYLQNDSKEFGIVHPLHGSYCNNMSIQKLYADILNYSSLEKSSTPILDVVTTSFYREGFPYAQEMVDLFLKCIDKNIPEARKIILYCEANKHPQINHCQNKVEIKNTSWPTAVNQEPTHSSESYEKYLSETDADIVLCVHIDSFAVEPISKLIDYAIKNKLVITSGYQVNDYTKVPKTNIGCPQLDLTWALINPKEWKRLDCHILDKDMLKTHPEIDPRMLSGSIYMFDWGGLFLLTWYLHVSRALCRFINPPHIHLRRMPNFLRVIYCILNDPTWRFHANSDWTEQMNTIKHFHKIYEKTFGYPLKADYSDILAEAKICYENQQYPKR